MKFLNYAALILTLTLFQGAKAATIEVQSLDDQALKQEMANPNPLVDATALDNYTQSLQTDNSATAESVPLAYPPHYGPPHHSHPPYHNPPPMYGPLTCYAQNAFQMTFAARGWGVSAYRLQDRAVRECQFRSGFFGVTCHSIGCRYY